MTAREAPPGGGGGGEMGAGRRPAASRLERPYGLRHGHGRRPSRSRLTAIRPRCPRSPCRFPCRGSSSVGGGEHDGAGGDGRQQSGQSSTSATMTPRSASMSTPTSSRRRRAGEVGQYQPQGEDVAVGVGDVAPAALASWADISPHAFDVDEVTCIHRSITARRPRSRHHRARTRTNRDASRPADNVIGPMRRHLLADDYLGVVIIAGDREVRRRARISAPGLHPVWGAVGVRVISLLAVGG